MDFINQVFLCGFNIKNLFKFNLPIISQRNNIFYNHIYNYFGYGFIIDNNDIMKIKFSKDNFIVYEKDDKQLFIKNNIGFCDKKNFIYAKELYSSVCHSYIYNKEIKLEDLMELQTKYHYLFKEFCENHDLTYKEPNFLSFIIYEENYEF